MKRTPFKRRCRPKFEEYHRQSKEWLENNGSPKQCKPCIDRNRMLVDACHVHHRKGRGIHLMDKRFWLPVCWQCHQWIHRNPKEARELGYMLDRLNSKI